MISREEILNLAALARLEVKEAEVETLQKDISSILEYVGQVSAIEGSKSEEKPAIRNVVREDAAYPGGAMLLGKREALLAAFPEREGDFNVVRKIIEKDEA